MQENINHPAVFFTWYCHVHSHGFISIPAGVHFTLPPRVPHPPSHPHTMMQHLPTCIHQTSHQISITVRCNPLHTGILPLLPFPPFNPLTLTLSHSVSTPPWPCWEWPSVYLKAHGVNPPMWIMEEPLVWLWESRTQFERNCLCCYTCRICHMSLAQSHTSWCKWYRF